MGAPKAKSHKPVYDDNMTGFLDNLSGSLSGVTSGPGVASSSEQLAALERQQQGASGYSNYWQQQMKGGGIDASDINRTANELLNPEYVDMLTDQSSKMLDQSFAQIGQAGVAGGNANSSRSGIAQGIAGSNAQANLGHQLTQYQNQVQGQATSLLQSERANQYGVAQAGQQALGQEVDLAGFQKSLEQGDLSADWTQRLLQQNPDLIRSLLYGQSANAGPLGTVG